MTEDRVHLEFLDCRIRRQDSRMRVRLRGGDLELLSGSDVGGQGQNGGAGEARVRGCLERMTAAVALQCFILRRQMAGHLHKPQLYNKQAVCEAIIKCMLQ